MILANIIITNCAKCNEVEKQYSERQQERDRDRQREERDTERDQEQAAKTSTIRSHHNGR